MKKINIVALVGQSGSGKTCASLWMGNTPGFNNVVSYTTRPMRPNEVNGIDHWFVKPEDKPSSEDILAYTKFGGYEYWTSWYQFMDTNVQYVYVIDEKGLLYLLEQEGFRNRVNLTAVRIVRSNTDDIDEDRKKRDDDRIVLDSSHFKYTVNNDGTLDEFKNKIQQLCSMIKNN